MAVSEDVVLRVVADIRKYQEEFLKVPGFTEKMAAQAAVRERRARVSEAAKAVREREALARKEAATILKEDRQAARKRAAEAKRVASANREISRVLEEQARAQMSASQIAVAEMRKEVAALNRLEKEGADAAAVAKARAEAVRVGAARVRAAYASERAAMSGATKATTALAKSNNELRNAAQSVAVQLPDVFSQIASGTPVMTVLVQQGMQVLQVNMGLVLKAGRALAAFMSGPMVVAIAAAVAAYSAFANQTDEQDKRLASFREALKATTAALDVSALRAYSKAQADMGKVVSDTTLLLQQELGLFDSLDIAQYQAVEAIKAKARAVTLEAASIWAKLQVQRQSLLAQLDSRDITLAEQRAANKRIAQLDRELPKAKAAIDAIKANVEAQQLQVYETYEQIRAVREQRDAERAASKSRVSGARDAAKAVAAEDAVLAAMAKRIADNGKRAYEQATERLDAFAKALQAAQAPFVDNSEIARLERLRDSLTEAANAASLTSEQAMAAQRSLALIGQRIAEINAQPMDAVRNLGTSVDESFALALDAAAEIADAIESIDWAGVWTRVVVDRARDAAKSAASVVVNTALGPLMNPAGLLQEIGEAASPKKARKLAKNMADQAVAFIDNLARNIGPFITALAKAMPDIAEALARATPKIVVALVKAVPHIAVALVKAVGQAAVALARSIARQVRKAVRAAVGLDNSRRSTRRVGDTPGPMRMPRGGTVQVAAGDTVVAARTEQGLRDQLGPAASRQAPVEVVTVLDVRDGPLRLGMSRMTTRELDRRGVGRDTTGRRRVY